MKNISYLRVQGGNVPGGHNVPYDGVRKPFITPMSECNSIELKHTDVVVDIGAYCGTYGIRCGRFPVKSVTMYEPTPVTFEILSMTKLVNAKMIQGAVVGDKKIKSVDLFISKGIGVTNSIVLSKNKEKSVTVPAFPYKDVVKGATIVKIDVEGAEYDYPIVQPGIRALIIDFHKVTGIDWKSKAEKMVSDIESAGFKPVIKPNFDSDCGWTLAGSWIRDIEEPTAVCDELMDGHSCCGCGAKFKEKTGKKSLCRICYVRWSKKHRTGFSIGKV